MKIKQNTKNYFAMVSALMGWLICSGFASHLFGQTPPPQTDNSRKAGERMVLTIKDIEYAFRWCPAGTFMMGSHQDEARRKSNETQRKVVLSHGFWMLETEVTQKMWEGVMGRNPSAFRSVNLPVESTNLPVEYVTWNHCQDYIKTLNEWGVAPTGFKFSLPTEAQWEYACRAGTTTAYHVGNTLNREQANFGGNHTLDVGSYPANAWGLRDMHGNVWEWCLDWYEEYSSETVTDPMGSPYGTLRVIRGGSWFYSAGFCRSALRLSYDPLLAISYIGLRLALVSE